MVTSHFTRISRGRTKSTSNNQPPQNQFRRMVTSFIPGSPDSDSDDDIVDSPFREFNTTQPGETEDIQRPEPEGGLGSSVGFQ